jgi:vesicle-associated membrane protein 7
MIANLMNTYNTAPPVDEIARAQTELNQVKDIMVQNVEQILSRGERIELLVDKTDVMAGQATAFRRGARSVRRQMWWRNKKILGLSILVALASGDFYCLTRPSSLPVIFRYCCGYYSRSSVVLV